MRKYLITAKNPQTGETTSFMVLAESKAAAREAANLADGWVIIEIHSIS